mgnify:CR=1 FL=1
MGAIGCYIPASFGIGESIDLSVAIRTMVIRDGTVLEVNRTEVDRILDKINSQGFASLTPDEKRVLDDAKDLLSRQ